MVSGYRGTTHEQDSRWKEKERNFILAREWPEEFSTRVDLRKIDIAVIEPWITRKIAEIIGFDDEIVTGMCVNYIKDQFKEPLNLDARRMQMHMTGFLERKSAEFCLELWKLLIEAQNSENGIPASLIKEKQQELQQKQDELQEKQQRLENLQKKILNMDSNPVKNIDKALVPQNTSATGLDKSVKEKALHGIRESAPKAAESLPVQQQQPQQPQQPQHPQQPQVIEERVEPTQKAPQVTVKREPVEATEKKPDGLRDKTLRKSRKEPSRSRSRSNEKRRRQRKDNEHQHSPAAVRAGDAHKHRDAAHGRNQSTTQRPKREETYSKDHKKKEKKRLSGKKKIRKEEEKEKKKKSRKSEKSEKKSRKEKKRNEKDKKKKKKKPQSSSESDSSDSAKEEDEDQIFATVAVASDQHSNDSASSSANSSSSSSSSDSSGNSSSSNQSK